MAFMVHVELVDAVSGARLLPALYSDNYFSLLPGQVVALDVRLSNVRCASPRLVAIRRRSEAAICTGLVGDVDADCAHRVVQRRDLRFDLMYIKACLYTNGTAVKTMRKPVSEPAQAPSWLATPTTRDARALSSNAASTATF